MATAPSYPANGVQAGDVSYVTLGVPDLGAAQAFYGFVLGWTFAPGSSPQGARVVGSAPMIGLWGDPADPEIGGRVGAMMAYRVDDIVAAVHAVRAHGGTATDVEQEPYALATTCTDPSGLRFWLHQMDDAPTLPDGARIRQGDLSYVTFGVPDGERDRAFYAAVLGWTYADGNPEGVLPMHGLWSPTEARGTQQLGAVLCYQVDDIDAAVTRLRAAGGSCDEPVGRPYGREAHGVDDAGIELYLHALIQT